MKKLIARAVALAAFVAVGAPAFADSQASASLENLTFTFGQIDTSPGAPAAYLFYPSAGGNGSGAVTDATVNTPSSGNPPTDESNVGFGVDHFDSATSYTSSIYANAYSSAYVMGSPTDIGGMWVVTQAFAGGGTCQDVTTTSFSTPTVGYMDIWMGANTYLNITATADLYAAGSGDQFNSATASAKIVGGIYGSSQALITSGAYLHTDSGAPSASPALTQDLSLSFAGTLNDPTRIDFEADSSASAQATGMGFYGGVGGSPIPSVPEPASAAMFLAGLGALGFIARRRKN